MTGKNRNRLKYGHWTRVTIITDNDSADIYFNGVF